MRHLLTTYAIPQPAALRPLLRLLLQHPPPPLGGPARERGSPLDSSIDTAIELCTAALGGSPLAEAAEPPAEPAGPADASRVEAEQGAARGGAECGAGEPCGMQLCASDASRTGALLEIFDHVRRSAPLQPACGTGPLAAARHCSYFATLSAVARAVFRADLAAADSAADPAAPPPSEPSAGAEGRLGGGPLAPVVATRLIAMVNAALALATRVCSSLRRGGVGGGCGHGGSGAAALDSWRGASGWLSAWRELATLLEAYCGWLRARRSGWPSASRRRVPSALYAAERLQLQLCDVLAPHAASWRECGELLEQVERAWRAGQQADGATLAVAASAGEDEDANYEADDVPAPEGGKSGRRMRSRNTFIDSELAQGYGGGDSFADLEDFIVVKKGRRY